MLFILPEKGKKKNGAAMLVFAEKTAGIRERVNIK